MLDILDNLEVMAHKIDLKWNLQRNLFGEKEHIHHEVDKVRERVCPKNDFQHCMTHLIGTNRGEIRNVQDSITAFQQSVTLVMQKMSNEIRHLEDIVHSQENKIAMLQNFVHQQSLQIQCLLLQNKIQMCDSNYQHAKSVICKRDVSNGTELSENTTISVGTSTHLDCTELDVSWENLENHQKFVLLPQEHLDTTSNCSLESDSITSWT